MELCISIANVHAIPRSLIVRPIGCKMKGATGPYFVPITEYRCPIIPPTMHLWAPVAVAAVAAAAALAGAQSD